MATGWDLVGETRHTFADLAESIADRKDEPTLAGSWTAHHVTAHVTNFVVTTFPKFFLGMLGAGFNYDKAADKTARALADKHSMGELAGLLRQHATKPSWIKSFPAELTLSDLAVHLQDIRRPLGIADPLPADVVRTALEFSLTHKLGKNIIGDTDPSSIAIEATDIGFSHGAGSAVRGTGEAILLGLAGRPVLDELEGDGVARLRG